MVGIDSPAVTVETHLQAGTPGFILVGLPESALRESRTRVKSAVQNSGFPYPQQRVVVNLAPANLAKEGTQERFTRSLVSHPQATFHIGAMAAAP